MTTPTREYVLSLPAGPELDALVADHVMKADRTASSPWRIRGAIFDAIPIGAEWDSRAVVLELGGQTYTVTRDISVKDRTYEAGWPWEQREGKPWQAAMEAYVAAWRAPPELPYSLTMTDVWHAVEHARKEGFRIELEDAGEYWLAYVRRGARYVDDPDYYYSGTVEAPTAPLAISRVLVLAYLRL